MREGLLLEAARSEDTSLLATAVVADHSIKLLVKAAINWPCDKK
jgi:hypothetical protein